MCKKIKPFIINVLEGKRKVDYKQIPFYIYILSFQKIENKIFKIKLKLKTYLALYIKYSTTHKSRKGIH